MVGLPTLLMTAFCDLRFSCPETRDPLLEVVVEVVLCVPERLVVVIS